MATLRRFVVLLLLVFAAPVAHPTPYSDNLQDACNKTLFPKVCIQSLTTNPETRTADARRLAELSVYVAKEVGTTVAAFAHHELTGVQDDNLFKCLDGCSTDIEETVAHLSALTREPTNAKFLEIKSWLSATLGGSNTCEETCKDAPISDVKNAVVTKSLEFEKLLRVTLDLITEASGSMSADVAMPPTAWDGSASGSYGASAPESYDSTRVSGSSSSSVSGTSSSSAPASEAPSTDASAPSSAPTSEAPSADAPGSYGSSAPSSEAPSTDSATPSDAPTSDAPSAGAPGPSYGSASGPAADAPSSSPSDADAPSSGAADSSSSGPAGAPSYGSAGAPSPSGADAPEADSPA